MANAVVCDDDHSERQWHATEERNRSERWRLLVIVRTQGGVENLVIMVEGRKCKGGGACVQIDFERKMKEKEMKEICFGCKWWYMGDQRG